jgi:hypothetical protein
VYEWSAGSHDPLEARWSTAYGAPRPTRSAEIPALATWTPEDGLLGALAPLGLALAAGSALVIDLDPGGPRYPGDRSLADLAADGVRAPDLEPRHGVAVLRNGGVTPVEAAPVVTALLERHPVVVLRLPPRPAPGPLPVPVVPVRLLIPGGWFDGSGPAVYQATPAWLRMPAEGVRLPVPARDTVAAIVAGRRPSGRDRWVAAWRRVWGYRWTR